MSITGCITDFSLPEIFHWAEKGKKSGLLTLRPLGDTQGVVQSVHYNPHSAPLGAIANHN